MTSTVAAPQTTVHSHTTTPAAQLAAASGWPRAFDPAQGINISGIGGVTADQESRARTLITNTMRDLQTYADYRTAVSAGYGSIGDGASGYEHYVKTSLVNDGKFLDSTAPESIVYRVTNGVKTVVSAMYIAPTFTPITDSVLTDYAGPLMQWHVHNNLCFGQNAQGSTVIVAIAVNGVCAKGVLQTNGSPMVHVWVVAHPCGPFAAVEESLPEWPRCPMRRGSTSATLPTDRAVPYICRLLISRNSSKPYSPSSRPMPDCL